MKEGKKNKKETETKGAAETSRPADQGALSPPVYAAQFPRHVEQKKTENHGSGRGERGRTGTRRTTDYAEGARETRKLRTTLRADGVQCGALFAFLAFLACIRLLFARPTAHYERSAAGSVALQSRRVYSYLGSSGQTCADIPLSAPPLTVSTPVQSALDLCSATVPVPFLRSPVHPSEPVKFGSPQTAFNS